MAEFTGVGVCLSTASAEPGRLLATSNGTLDAMGGNVACFPQVVAKIIIIITIDCLFTLISAYIDVIISLIRPLSTSLLNPFNTKFKSRTPNSF